METWKRSLRPIGIDRPFRSTHDPAVAMSVWYPDSTLSQILAKTPSEHHNEVIASWEDLSIHTLLQAHTATGAGVQSQARHWRGMGGDVARPNRLPLTLAGGCMGGILGAVLMLPQETASLPVPAIAWPGAGTVLGILGGFIFAGMQRTGFGDATIHVYVNEHRSRKRKFVITDHLEVWVPKALFSWRQYDWQEYGGELCLWLRVPYGRRLSDVLRYTKDLLLLPVDPHRALESATATRRNLGRMVSINANGYAAVDAMVTDPPQDGGVTIMKNWGWIGVFVVGTVMLVYGRGDA